MYTYKTIWSNLYLKTYYKQIFIFKIKFMMINKFEKSVRKKSAGIYAIRIMISPSFLVCIPFFNHNIFRLWLYFVYVWYLLIYHAKQMSFWIFFTLLAIFVIFCYFCIFFITANWFFLRFITIITYHTYL